MEQLISTFFRTGAVLILLTCGIGAVGCEYYSGPLDRFPIDRPASFGPKEDPLDELPEDPVDILPDSDEVADDPSGTPDEGEADAEAFRKLREYVKEKEDSLREGIPEGLSEKLVPQRRSPRN